MRIEVLEQVRPQERQADLVAAHHLLERNALRDAVAGGAPLRLEFFGRRPAALDELEPVEGGDHHVEVLAELCERFTLERPVVREARAAQVEDLVGLRLPAVKGPLDQLAQGGREDRGVGSHAREARSQLAVARHGCRAVSSHPITDERRRRSAGGHALRGGATPRTWPRNDQDSNSFRFTTARASVEGRFGTWIARGAPPPRGTVNTETVPGGLAGMNRSAAVKNASGPNGNGTNSTLLTPSEPSSNRNTAAEPAAIDAHEAVVGLITFVPSISSTSLAVPRSPQNSRWRTTERATWFGLASMNGASPVAMFNRIRWSLRTNGS